ncbi:hypothetical protein O0A26_11525, partial [Staphylococcus pseudintermedius]|nr:hypothetical protein [Staphylococcus pseudintermedius]
QYDEIFVTHEIPVLLPKSNLAPISCMLQSSRIELEGQPLGKGNHDGNQKPKIVGRVCLTKYCINRIKSFYVPPLFYFMHVKTPRYQGLEIVTAKFLKI